MNQNDEEKDTDTFSASSSDLNGNPLPGVNPGGLDGRPRDLYRYTVRPERSAERDFDIVTWKVGAEWDTSENIMLYANASTGFLSGGVNSDGTPFEQQESIAYEAS